MKKTKTTPRVKPDPTAVTLAEMNSKQAFVQFRHFFPQNLHPESSENLSSKNSAFAVTARNTNMLIIEDISKELALREPRYAASKTEQGNSGCIICIPIQVQPLDGIPRIPFILSIKCDETKIFLVRRKQRYEYLSGPFLERIRLEFYNEKIQGVSR